ncbi:MAG: FAD binding domain-containing protein [Planctomycetota bacterium]
MTNSRDCVVFHLNGLRCEVSGASALLMVSEYLRQERGLVGTKIVCSEGDCGSCTVLVGRPAGDRLQYLPIDSCIQFVFQLDGAHLVTVEGLQGTQCASTAAGVCEGELTAVQQSMVDCHGSQCGFCTPGFVMAMTAVVEETNGTPPDEATWRESLTGNLCRCTGYSQIIEAGHQAAAASPAKLNTLYPPEAMLAHASDLRSQPIDIRANVTEGPCQIYSPVDLQDALQFRKENPNCCVVAGATDLGVQRNKGRVLPDALLDLNRIDSLTQLTVEDGTNDAAPTLVAGARVNWTDLLEWSRQNLPEYARVLEVFGSPQIRHAGTLGGNIINASPIADSLPLLFALDAQLCLSSTEGDRMVNITEFYTDYKQYDLRPEELLTEVRIPLPDESDLLRLYKISRRRDLDISTFTAAIRLQLDGDTITDAAVAYGAVGPTVLRMRQTEEALIGEPFTTQTMQAAGDAAVAEITPLTDVRGAADYRYQLARNVLQRFHAEHAAGQLATSH